jgi:hypothetical protein
MRIKKFAIFENFTTDEADEIKSLFYDIIDLEHDSFQVRGDSKVLDRRYQKVIRTNSEITDGGNFIFRIYCDFSFNYSIEKEVREEIVPRIKSLGYKVSLKNEKTSEYIGKELPISGTDRTSYVSDPVHRISILVKK